MTRFVVSIHDVMPETLDRVDVLLSMLEDSGWGSVTLLVVPGRAWTSDSMRRLHDYAERGHRLAGHGWTHSVPRLRGLRHRIHSLLISRRAAEHYSLDRLGVQVLVRRCRHWFERNELPAPELYVPPAWGLGPASVEDLAGLGFRFVETLTGITDTATGQSVRLPLLGFEADGFLRAAAVRLSNAANAGYARYKGAVRLAIHPYDLDLRLADSLRSRIGRHAATIDIEGLPALNASS